MSQEPAQANLDHSEPPPPPAPIAIKTEPPPHISFDHAPTENLHGITETAQHAVDQNLELQQEEEFH